MDERLASKHIVLLGVGHTNAHIVRMWGMNPIPDTDLTCISNDSIATYSGMLPAVLAGQIPEANMQIDLVRLCASVGARLLTNDVAGLDPNLRLIHFEDRPSIPFDALSIGIGSVPSTAGAQIEGDSLLKIKPMQTFLPRLTLSVDAVLQRKKLRRRHPDSTGTEISDAPIEPETLKVVVVGSGVAGMEITFCLPAFLRNRTSAECTIRVVSRSDEILPGVTSSMRRRVLAELNHRQIAVTSGRAVVKVSDDLVLLDDGLEIAADLVIWATGAAAPELLAKLNLPLDDRGFLETHDTLRSTSGHPVFAVGDSGTIDTERLPKAGVYAVRQGPILWENLRRIVDGRDLLSYRPQRSFLKLLNTGDGRAIGEWKNFSFTGEWVMKLKDRIDSKFMQMYQPRNMSTDGELMQCRGCGCKLGGDVLAGALSRVEDATAGPSDSLDDAAVIETSGGRILASTDFFTSPVDDPFLAGRIAALHSASDLVAMGASITAALANVVVPEGDPQAQQRGLNDLLAGARTEFAAMGADVVGGHTIVGSRWEIGFTVIGEPLSQNLLRKQDLKSGDALFLTKPLGIGVLLAAHMRHACRAADYNSMIRAMLTRQHDVGRIAAHIGIVAGTDVTGFGLIGHLIEMLQASGKSASIELNEVPLLPGAAAAFDSGIESSLAPANRHVERLIEASGSQRISASYKALFDPQTCGGLLLGVPSHLAAVFEEQLQAIGTATAVKIGDISDFVVDGPLVRLAQI